MADDLPTVERPEPASAVPSVPLPCPSCKTLIESPTTARAGCPRCRITTVVCACSVCGDLARADARIHVPPGWVLLRTATTLEMASSARCARTAVAALVEHSRLTAEPGPGRW